MSPWTIHFRVLDKSPVSGPGRGPPSCNKRTSIIKGKLHCSIHRCLIKGPNTSESILKTKNLSPGKDCQSLSAIEMCIKSILPLLLKITIIGVGNRNAECYLIHINFHLNKQSLLCYCCYQTCMKTRVPWKIQNPEKSLRKSGSPEQNLVCYLETRNQGVVFQVPCRINVAVCPQPEPVLQGLLHSSLSWGTLRTGKIIQCACLGDRACCSVIRLDSALCRHHLILKTEPCLSLWGIFYDIIRMSLFFFAAQVYHAKILGGSLSWKCT